MMSEAATLLELGFILIGEWRTPECRVHRDASIRHQRGIYAFVVGHEVKYFGKTETLHRRLRNYSNRCFRKSSTKDLRYCHDKIIEAVNARDVVSAYALVIGETDTNLIEVERAFIQRFSPPWNKA